MISFKNWKNENYAYVPEIDGKALDPHKISGAQVQIRHLASMLRSSFTFDDSFEQHHEQIRQATYLLEKAADLLGQNMGDDRNRAHKFHYESPKNV